MAMSKKVLWLLKPFALKDPTDVAVPGNHGDLIIVRWPVLVPPPYVSGPQFDYHIEHRPQVQKPKPRLPRFPGTATSVGSFNANGFKSHNTFFELKEPLHKAKNIIRSVLESSAAKLLLLCSV